MCDLLVISSLGKSNFYLSNYFTRQEIWLGAYNLGSLALKEQRFTWNSDSQPINEFEHFQSSQPNFDGQCMIIEDDGDWYDRACNEKKDAVLCILN